jgi:type I restriction enzyme S subunit
LQAVATIERNVVEASAIEGGTPYVGLENIQSGGDFVDVRQVGPGELASSKFAFTPHHLLYGKLRPYLAKIARPDFSGICSTDILPILPGPDLDRRYLAHFLLRPESVAWATSRAAGANLPRLSPRGLAEMTIPVPPLPEQRRIADVLDRAEALRAKRRAALARLDALTQSIFLDMFGDPARPPNHPAIEPLGKHLVFVTSGSRGWAQYYAPTGSRFIRSLDVQMNRFGVEDMAFVVPPQNAEARRTQVRGGDVLLTITGSRIGRVAAVPDELQGSYISQHVAILRVNSKRLDPIFLAHFLSLEAGGQRQIAKAQYGQTKPGLNFEQIRRFQIPVPSIDLQREFARRVAWVEQLKSTHQASLSDLDALFASLQHRAFRGEL